MTLSTTRMIARTLADELGKEMRVYLDIHTDMATGEVVACDVVHVLDTKGKALPTLSAFEKKRAVGNNKRGGAMST